MVDEPEPAERFAAVRSYIEHVMDSILNRTLTASKLSIYHEYIYRTYAEGEHSEEIIASFRNHRTHVIAGELRKFRDESVLPSGEYKFEWNNYAWNRERPFYLPNWQSPGGGGGAVDITGLWDYIGGCIDAELVETYALFYEHQARFKHIFTHIYNETERILDNTIFSPENETELRYMTEDTEEKRLRLAKIEARRRSYIETDIMEYYKAFFRRELDIDTTDKCFFVSVPVYEYRENAKPYPALFFAPTILSENEYWTQLTENIIYCIDNQLIRLRKRNENKRSLEINRRASRERLASSSNSSSSSISEMPQNASSSSSNPDMTRLRDSTGDDDTGNA
jgi:hypothetical protein